MITFKRFFRPLPLAVSFFVAVAGVSVVAQIEGGERGVAPIDSSGSFEVGGVGVDVVGKSADAARLRGWREAQRKGWQLLWQRTHGGGAPGLSDGALDGIVSGIIIEDEQIGPNRYIARLGVMFDRVRAGQILGVSGSVRRSAPLLVVPVQWSGGFAQSFETRTEWQKAWARFRTSGSSIDYVRVAGTGADPLLLNAGQMGRPGRKWWRTLLDQYGAADVLVPQVRLERAWPGGPVTGYFSARYGPDNRLLQSFALRVQSSAGLPKLMDEGVRRIDEIYAMALASGSLRPDTSLIIEQPIDVEGIEDDVLANVMSGVIAETVAGSAPPVETSAPATIVKQFTIQFDTPDVGSVGSAESAVRNIPGIKSATTSSLALGGVSVMRVAFDGDADMLRVALSARGYRVQESGGVFRIRRTGN